jgi:hypothetical protein
MGEDQREYGGDDDDQKCGPESHPQNQATLSFEFGLIRVLRGRPPSPFWHGAILMGRT